MRFFCNLLTTVGRWAGVLPENIRHEEYRYNGENHEEMIQHMMGKNPGNKETIDKQDR